MLARLCPPRLCALAQALKLMPEMAKPLHALFDLAHCARMLAAWDQADWRVDRSALSHGTSC